MAEQRREIYLDYNATTPCDQEVLESMLPYFLTDFGNAASKTHPFGWRADEGVEGARTQVANLIGASPQEIVFTSGATEALNLALKGVFEAYHRKGKHILCARTEHKAVLDSVEFLQKKGAEIEWLEVDKQGRINLQEIKESIRNDTLLIAVMWANNETGVIQPVEDIGNIASEMGVLFLCDATQAVGKIPVDTKQSNIHLMAFSAHKMYGPKGIGALYVSSSNPRVALTPLIHGGKHERGLRSGTLNVPGIVGFGKACEIALDRLDTDHKTLKALRDRLEEKLTNIEGAFVNGDETERLGHVLNIGFPYVHARSLIGRLNGAIALSTGSACTSADLEPSHVLSAMGIEEDKAHSSVRLSVGRQTTTEEIDQVVEVLSQSVRQIRRENPLWQLHKQGIEF